jgi:hypothetical protein
MHDQQNIKKVSFTIAPMGKYQFFQLTYNDEYLYFVSTVSAKLQLRAIQPDSGLNPLHYTQPLVPFYHYKPPAQNL